ncbi:MAG: chloride channel protein [Bacteroidales bacterium]|jgi:CIC family chloride channel protein|nr:chloride channel protein [Bacteroidales bacterium]
MALIFQQLLFLREKHIQEKHFVLILSFFVGLCAALTAIMLKLLLHLIQQLLTNNFSISNVNFLYLIYPAVGITLAALLVKFVVKDDISHGVTKILFAISQKKSRIKPHNIWSSVLASSLTIGFGGSVGAEAPIVLTGSAIGSNIGRLFKMEQRTLMLLVGCGAAGAIAGIFKAPIAGLVFTIEVLMLDLTLTSVMPLLIASVTAAVVSYFFNGTEAMFKFSLTEPFEMQRIPYVLLLGVFCGLVSLYFTRMMNWLEGHFRKITSWYKKLLLGIPILSLLIFIFPPLYGEGYDTITMLLDNESGKLVEGSLFFSLANNYWLFVGYLLLIVLFKVFASSATNGAGGTGGIFDPSLFLGCVSVFIFSHSINYFDIIPYIPEKNFSLMGMAGVMAGVMHAPLTGTFLIAELTGGYDLFLPLMLVTISSYLTIIAFEPHSIYSMRLAQKGELLTHHKDKAVLTLLKIESVIETDFLPVKPEMYLGDLIKVISRSSRNIFPVVDGDGVFKGVVLLDDIRNIMFRQELYYRFRIKKVMMSPPARIYLNMPMEKVMQVFDDTNAWNLPVLDDDERYIGFVSKSKIFNSYRKVLVHFSED